jgi:hypothetical protein
MSDEEQDFANYFLTDNIDDNHAVREDKTDTPS